MNIFENKAVVPRVLDRAGLSRDLWRAYVLQQLEAAPGVCMESLPSGAIRITRGHSNIMTDDVSTIRSAELDRLIG